MATAHAAADPAHEAADLFRAGREAMKEGRYVDACSSFEGSARLDPLPGTALNLAVCQERVGHLVAARVSVDDFLSRARPGDDRIAKASALASDLLVRTPSLRLIAAEESPPDLKVFVDGVEIPHAEWQKPLLEDPGVHRVRVAASGHVELTFEVELAEGARLEKSLDLRPLENHAPKAVAPSPTVSEEKTLPGGRHLSGAFYVTASVATVSFIAAGVSGAMVLVERNRVDNHCVAKSCDPQGLQAGHRGTTFALVNTITLPLAVTAGAAAFYLFLTADDDRSVKSTLTVAIDPLHPAFVLQGSY